MLKASQNSRSLLIPHSNPTNNQSPNNLTLTAWCRKPLQILDARPRMNAVANQLMGAGSEKMAAYEVHLCLCLVSISRPLSMVSDIHAGQNTKRKFLGIANIHVMRQSLNKMRKFFLAEERTIAQIEAKVGPSFFLASRQLSRCDCTVRGIDCRYRC
jgi:hypothetical protein